MTPTSSTRGRPASTRRRSARWRSWRFWSIGGLCTPCSPASSRIGLALGRRFCLPCLLYFELIQPRVGEGAIEDARPPRFANLVGVAVLGGAAIAHAAGAERARLRARLARRRPRAPLGRDRLLRRVRDVQLGARVQGIRSHQLDRVDLAELGATPPRASSIQFTHPLCTDCRALEARLRAEGQSRCDGRRLAASGARAQVRRRRRPDRRRGGRGRHREAAARLADGCGRAPPPKLTGPLGRIHVRLYRLTGGVLGGHVGRMPVLLLTTTGRRTKKQRTTPLLYLADGDRLVVVASYGGAPQHPAWFLNLEATPDVEAQVRRDRRRVRARVATAEEREALLAAPRRDLSLLRLLSAQDEPRDSRRRLGAAVGVGPVATGRPVRARAAGLRPSAGEARLALHDHLGRGRDDR